MRDTQRHAPTHAHAPPPDDRSLRYLGEQVGEPVRRVERLRVVVPAHAPLRREHVLRSSAAEAVGWWGGGVVG